MSSDRCQPPSRENWQHSSRRKFAARTRLSRCGRWKKSPPNIAPRRQRQPTWIKQRLAPILYQTAIKRHPLLPHVPTIAELGLDEEAKGVLRAVAASSEIGRSIITTPGVPKERIAALRTAFQAMMADPAFIDAMAKRDIMVFSATGEEMDEVTREVMKTPKPVLELTKALLKQK